MPNWDCKTAKCYFGRRLTTFTCAGWRAMATLLCANVNETLSEPCQVLLRSLFTTRHPTPGIAVFSPRRSPSLRYTSRLKFFNQTFLDLCDTVAFPDLSPTSVWPQSPFFLYLDTAHAAKSTWERLVEKVDKIHTGELRRASFVFLHISRAGRKRVVWTEVFAFTERSSLVEFLIVETPLPEDFPVEPPTPLIAQPRIDAVTPAEVVSAELAALKHQESSLQLRERLFAARRDSVKKQKSERRGFTCSECGESETSQRRYVSRKVFFFVLPSCVSRWIPDFCDSMTRDPKCLIVLQARTNRRA